MITQKRELSSNDNSIYRIKRFIDEVNEQFEDHLQAINENTNEIESNYELLSDLNKKIDKISERLEKIELFLHEKANFNLEEKQEFSIEPLTKREKEVFLILYTLEETKDYVTYLDIAKRTGLTEDLVSSYIKSLIDKDIPILKKYINGKAHLRLNAAFKTLQAKENILQIEQRTIITSF